MVNCIVGDRKIKATVTAQRFPRRRMREGFENLDVNWVRRSHGVCGYLEAVHALSPSERALVTFAITWAPYGGAHPEELLVAFGVQRVKFIALLKTALESDTAEAERVQELKRMLRDDLVGAWDVSTAA